MSDEYQAAKDPTTVKGRTILAVALVGALLFFALTYAANRVVRKDLAIDYPPLSWAKRAEWPSPPMRRVSLERAPSNYGYNRVNTQWRETEVRFETPRLRELEASGAQRLAEAEGANATASLVTEMKAQSQRQLREENERIEQTLRQCAALARLETPGSDTHEAAGDAMDVPFNHPSVRERLERLAAEHPDVFYPHYLLATWHRVTGDAAKADELNEKAFALAPAAIKLRFVDPGDLAMEGLPVGAIEVSLDRVRDDRLDQTLKLVYPRLVTDGRGFVYLPTFRAAHRFSGLPEIEGYNVRYDLEGWYEFPGRVGVPKAAIVWPKR